MPTNADQRDILLDTSVAIPLMVADHAFHAETVTALAGRRLGLAGHAEFEVYSVLTRLPAPARRTPSAAARLIAANFPATRRLSAADATSLLSRMERAGIAGGAVYDALIAAAALQHGIGLVTRDSRALKTYRALGLEPQVL